MRPSLPSRLAVIAAATVIAAVYALVAPRSAGAQTPADTATRRVPFTTTTVIPGGTPSDEQAGPRARMEPPRVPPAELFGDSAWSVRVMVGADAKPMLETLRLHDGSTALQQAAARRWLEEATFVLPMVDGKPVAAPFHAMGRRGARGAVRSSSAMGGALAPSGASPEAAAAMEDRFATMMGRAPRLSPDRLRALSKRAARLATDLDTIHVRPGLRLTMSRTVKVAILDSAGAVLGFLPFFDSESYGGVIRDEGLSIAGAQEGTTALMLKWPRALWDGAGVLPPSVTITVVNSVRVTDDQLARQAIPTGSGTGQCTLGLRDADCMMLEQTSSHETTEYERIRLMVIQRGLPSRDLTALRAMSAEQIEATNRRMTEHQRAVEDRGRSFWGRHDAQRGAVGVETGRFPSDTVYVGERSYVAPWHRDSALVLLVDHRGGAAPVVSTLTVPSAMPDGVQSKSWRNGDTLFTVMPRDASRKWREYFDRHPAIADFLR